MADVILAIQSAPLDPTTVNPFSNHPDLRLLPEGAVFLTDSAVLVLSDVHLGKSAAFRAKGLPIPEGDTALDLQRMLDLARTHQAKRLVVAGDLFHAPAGITPELEAALERFLHELAVPFSLVVGNHDAKLKRIPPMITKVSYLDLGEHIRILHDPDQAEGGRLHITGHWHPVVRIPDGKRTSLRLPCFLHRNNVLVLPAFGSFTGGAIMQTGPDDRTFVSHQGQVIELPAGLLKPSRR